MKRAHGVGRAWKRLTAWLARPFAWLKAWWHRETDHDALDLIQGLVDVVRDEQHLHEDLQAAFREMQRELRVMQRQVVELRLNAFEKKPEVDARMVSIRLPRLDAAMAEVAKAQAFKAKEN